MHNPCPSDETLVDFLEGRLSGSRQLQMESHLVVCSNCREQVGAFLEITAADSMAEPSAAPEHLTNKAVRMVTDLSAAERSRPRFQGARRWIDKGLALLEHLTPSGGPEPVMVRSSDTELEDQRISRRKQFDDVTFTIDIERSSQDQAFIRVAGTEPDALKPPIRVTLLIGNREVASMVMVDTPLVFDDITFGAYRLVFVRSGIHLGEYAFEITVDADDTHR